MDQRLHSASPLLRIAAWTLILFAGRADAGDVPFGPQRMIMGGSAGNPTSVFAADLDGDGDQDVLSASRNGKIAWYENTDGMGAFGLQQTIATFLDSSTSVFAADVDGDGDKDVLSASSGRIVWHENTDGMGAFGPQQVITTSVSSAQSVFAADLDGDGDQDVLSASFLDDKIAWYENTDGMGAFGPQLVINISDPDGSGGIDGNADGPFSVFAADLDGDGDQDVLSASALDDKIAWYENTDGMGAFGPQQAINTPDPDSDPGNPINGDANYARSVFAADLDGDGNIDVLSASALDGKIAWYHNTDGAGVFGPQREISPPGSCPYSVFAADLDGDGDLDVLAASPGAGRNLFCAQLVWYENTDGMGAFWAVHVIAKSSVSDRHRSVYAADLDGDGDHDVLSALSGDNKIAWYENTDGMGAFGTQKQIVASPISATSVFAADLDGDGDQDVLSALSGSLPYPQGEIAWSENTDGMGSFGLPQTITTSVASPQSVFAADLDGDGDQDVLSASETDDKIAWYENTDGLGAFGPQQVITTLAHRALSVFAADLDGDGDQDVLSAFASRIAWHENTDGLGAFGPQQLITFFASFATSVFAADLDGDGDQDVLSASRFDDKIAWYENTDGLGVFGPQQTITTSARDAQSVYAADLDGDGDQDVLSASFFRIAWYENLTSPNTVLHWEFYD